jgi:uncharacterized protein (DUF1778 family)
MRAFHDHTKSLDERATERMHFRAKPRIKEAIQQAAALSGVDDSVFTMNAAYQIALETISAHERTILKPVDHAVFFSALENGQEPTDHLRQAFVRHKARVVSK